jgi:hypothetical protein
LTTVQAKQVSSGRGVSYNLALRVSKITQPSSRVELCKDSADLPLLGTNAKATTLSFDCGLYASDTDALDRQSLIGEPADDDGVASVPEVQDLERNGGLGSLSGEEFCF